MMSKSQILKKIGNIIEELSEQQQYLASTNKINLLELELFTANADFLIDHIEFLKKLNDKRYDSESQDTPALEAKTETKQAPQPEIVEKPQEVDAEKEEKPRKFSFSLDEEPTEMIFDFERKIAVDVVFDRPLNNDEKRLLEEKSSAPEPKEEEFIVLDDVEVKEEVRKKEDDKDIEPYLITEDQRKSKASATENQPLEELVNYRPERFVDESFKADEMTEKVPQQSIPKPATFKEEDTKPFPADEEPQNKEVSSPLPVAVEEKRLTLNEMLSAKLKQSGASHQRKKLDDLKAAISINDKMVFIKELFNGYNLAYSEAIEIVNRFESFESADNFLQKNYSVKNDWENKQVTVARFYEYLQQKFVI